MQLCKLPVLEYSLKKTQKYILQFSAEILRFSHFWTLVVLCVTSERRGITLALKSIFILLKWDILESILFKNKEHDGLFL